LPVDGLQSLFALLDPQLVLRKFAAFAALENSDRLRDFLHLEDWLNDGVALAGKVAKECLLGWYGENTPAEGRWRVAGVTVDPSRLEVPTQVMIPAKDRIVPPPSARALARQLPSGAEVLTPSLGHIGMIVGRRAPAQVWAPLSRWLGEIGRS
jgi:polyhydroxyalkanoate synthase